MRADASITGDRFFQSNDFLYFTGVEAPNGWLVVDGVNRESTLFLTLEEHDARGEGIPPELVVDPEGFTGIERALPVEVALVREAARIGVVAHLEFMHSTEVGMPERAPAALFEFTSKRAGAQELAYETIVMAGPHHPWGHYHQHDRTLEDGDFIILDAGLDYAYYNADISTSFPANGRFTQEQREIYELGLGIRQVCLDNYRAGTTFAEVGEKVREWLTANEYDATERRFRALTRWGCYNHPIGMATHDVMASMTGPEEPLEPGFVFACDINTPQSETLGIRIEDTVVITEEGYENLSTGLPRTVQEIEDLMREAGLLQKVSG